MKHSLSILTIGFIAIALLSCKAFRGAQGEPEIHTSIVPADFNPRKHVLLVAEMPRPHSPEKRHKGATKKLVKQMEKTYPYPFELISYHDISDLKGKYADTVKYKYAMVSSIHSSTRTSNTTLLKSSNSGTKMTTLSPTINIYSIDYRFYDRVRDSLYSASGNGSSSLAFTVPAFTQTIQAALTERKKQKTAK